MMAAVDTLALPPANDLLLRDYLERAAHSHGQLLRGLSRAPEPLGAAPSRKTLQEDWTSFPRAAMGNMVPVTDVLDSAVPHRHADPPGRLPRRCLVAPRRDLPDLPALVGRRRRRRHRRPARHHRPPALPEALGVDAVWFSPFYRSPQADAGYDVADYRDIDPIVRHPRRRRRHARAGPRARPEGHRRPGAQPHLRRARVVPGGAGGRPRQPRARPLHVPRRHAAPTVEQPPNDWHSVFGGPAWTRVTEADGTPGQWYLHLFDSSSPTSTGSNPEVRRRVRVHPAVLARPRRRRLPGRRRPRPDQGRGPARLRRRGPPPARRRGRHGAGAPKPPMWDQDGVHEIYRQWRALLDAYGRPDRILCAEAWVRAGRARGHATSARDEMHQAFNFDYLQTPWRAADLRRRHRGLAARQPTRSGAPSTWVLSNHDVVRHASRLGLPVGAAAAQRHRRRRPAARPRARPAPGPRRDRADAGAARRRLPLPGRGARACPTPPTCPTSTARTRPSAAPTAGDRPRRLPGADAVAEARPPRRGSRSSRPAGRSTSVPRERSPDSRRAAARARPTRRPRAVRDRPGRSASARSSRARSQAALLQRPGVRGELLVLGDHARRRPDGGEAGGAQLARSSSWPGTCGPSCRSRRPRSRPRAACWARRS